MLLAKGSLPRIPVVPSRAWREDEDSNGRYSPIHLLNEQPWPSRVRNQVDMLRLEILISPRKYLQIKY